MVIIRRFWYTWLCLMKYFNPDTKSYHWYHHFNCIDKKSITDRTLAICVVLLLHQLKLPSDSNKGNERPGDSMVLNGASTSVASWLMRRQAASAKTYHGFDKEMLSLLLPEKFGYLCLRPLHLVKAPIKGKKKKLLNRRVFKVSSIKDDCLWKTICETDKKCSFRSKKVQTLRRNEALMHHGDCK